MQKIMQKKVITWIISLVVIILIATFGIEKSRHFMIAVIVDTFLFLKENILTIIAAFFLVKGKFILMLFLKKLVILSATGLGKRYLIEKVFNHNLKIHFLDHIGDDVKRLSVYIKENFKDFPIVKQLIAIFTFLASLGFVGKFMGGMLAMKVFIAKFWSFILAIVLKFSTAIVYFFSDYLWGSWIAPLIEVLIFSWLLEWMERVPFLKKYLQKIYHFFLRTFSWFEVYMEKIFHIPIKRFFRFLARVIKQYIDEFIGYNRVSLWQRRQEAKALSPNKHILLVGKRRHKKETKKEKNYLSSHTRLHQKRKS